MRLCITGGAGFIGSNLAALALSQGHEVVVVDDFSTGYRDNLRGLAVALVEGSITDRGVMASALVGVDSIVHLGALGSVPRSIADPSATHLANATGTLIVLESARDAGVGHVVSASSSSVYGLNPALPKNEREWVRPLSPYAVTKLATEQYTLAYQQAYGLKSMAFRFFNVYGPKQRAGDAYAAVIPTFMNALLHGAPVWINGDGHHSRDFTYVETVATVLLDAAVRRVSHPEPVNLAFGTNTTLLALIAALEETTGMSITPKHRGVRPGDVPHSKADNTVLRTLFPEISPIPLAEGLRQTWKWFYSKQ